ncbi:MAG: GntR family transcriptional regulator [Actinobacteria bacterium 13_1_20CM_3_71_11]|nr:MAG: GntR family transcriptional regulator [Actinobacteria bacterium 13_1_20CM_3_71_11]
MLPGRAPAYQLLADDLREQITSGQLRPGERLPTEPQLCVRSGVSRSTVREALRLLASQHLIVTTRGVTGGSYVAKPDAATLAESLSRGVNLMVSATAVGIAELLEVRDLVEVPAAGLAARRRTDADVATLGKTLFDPVRDDTPVKVAAQRAFHEALAAATGNPVYELLARPLYAVANASDIAERAPLRLWRAIDADHRAIMRAVLAGDPVAAERAARVHLANLRASLLDGH